MGAISHNPITARSWRELLIRQKMARKGGEHPTSRCMQDGCKVVPEVECIWADGRGRAWHCQKHHDAWVKENEDTEGQDDWMPLDIVKQRKVPNGVVGEKYGEYPGDGAKKARIDLDRILGMFREADAKDGKTTGYRDGVGLFIRLPEQLAKQFPSLAPEDNSPPHVTFLFIGKVPEEQDDILLETVNRVFAQGLPTIKAKLGDIDYFVHPDKDRRVAHCPVVFNRGMSELRTRLRSALEDAGIEVADSFPIYRPHVTLQYVPGTDGTYKGPAPSGDWEFDEVEIWGLPKEHKVSFHSGKRAKAIPIDKSALRGVAKRLEKQFVQAIKVAMRAKANEPIRWREVWVRDSHTIRTVMGEDVTVDLLVTAGKDRGPGPYVNSGGYGFVRRTGRAVVIVKLNGSYTAAEYAPAAESGMLHKGIYNILIHEMTHAADAAIKAQYEAGPASGPYTVKDEAAYYNDPKEVRAFMQQVVDEVLSYGGKRKNLEKVFELFKGPRDRGLEVVLKNTETWPEIKEHLTPTNRNKILKAVYMALVDGGVIKTAISQSAVAWSYEKGPTYAEYLYKVDWYNRIFEPKKPLTVKPESQWLSEKLRGLNEWVAQMPAYKPKPKSVRGGTAKADGTSWELRKKLKFKWHQFNSDSGWFDVGGKEVWMHERRRWKPGKSGGPGTSGTYVMIMYPPGTSPKEVAGKTAFVDRLVMAHLSKLAGYYSVDDVILYGKYKNKKGRVVGIGKDEKGNPTIDVDPIPKGQKKTKTLSVLKVWHADPEKRAVVEDGPTAPTEFEQLMQKEFPSFEDTVTTLVAKYQEKHKDQDGNTHYEYSEKQVQHRDREKAKRIEGLKSAMPKLQSKVKKDLKSKDPKTRLTALAVALMDDTYERVGNDSSADDGHFGVTGWQASHISFGGSTATVKYTGKSGVKHEKKISTPSLVSALRDAMSGKEKSTKILGYECEEGDTCVSPDNVNEYLDEFGITAKDIRGYHANDEMLSRLKSVRDKGPSLPSDRKEKDEILKKEFEQALSETAETVGHEAATLKSNYLVPGMHDSYMHDGSVMDSFTKKGTKDDYEKEQESAEGLLKKEPKKKPPRDDLRRRRMKDNEDDPDLKPPNATNDPDLSHNYKGRNARSGRRLHLMEGGYRGEKQFRMDVKEDLFVHFTPSSHALGIIKDGKLKVNPPYRQFGGAGVYGVSLVYGSGTPSVQTTHIKTDEELVGIVFRTNAVPDIGFVEEVVWNRDVPLRSAKLVPARQAFGMLSQSPEKIGNQDQVYYEGSANLRKVQDMSVKAAALVMRYIQAKGEPEWAEGKTFPHKTEDGQSTQVGWKSLSPEEQSKYQKDKDKNDEEESKGKNKKDDDSESKGKNKKDDGESKGKNKKDDGESKDKKPKETGDPALTPALLAQDPGSARLLWSAAKGDKDGPPSATELADLFEHVKGTRITEETAQKILDTHAATGGEGTLGEAIAAEEKKVINEFVVKTGIKVPALKKRLESMSPEARQTMLAAMQETDKEYMASPVSTDEAAQLAQEHDGKVSAKDLPKDPAKLGKYLAARAYTQNVVLNPLMTGGRAVNDEEKSLDEISARSAAAYDTFKELETPVREKAAGKVLDRLGEVDPKGNEAKELNAVLDGLTLAGALRGENTPGRPPPSAMFTEIAKSMERQGEAHDLLKAVDQNSTEGRDALRKGLEGMSDEAMVSSLGGTDVLDAMGERLMDSGVSPESQAAIRQMMIDLASDDIQFIDPMIRDGLEAKGEKGKALNARDRDAVKKEIHDKSFEFLSDPGEMDDATRKNLRFSILQQAVVTVRKWLGSAKSMAVTQVDTAIEADEPDLLKVPASKPVSRPIEGKGESKKGAQSGAYTPTQLSEGPSPFEEWGMIEPESPRPFRRKMMSKLLTKKGAEQMLDHAGRLAHVIQHNWKALGIPSEKHAMDLAFRLDLFGDTVERVATENERTAAARKQAETLGGVPSPTVGEGTIKDQSGAPLRGGTPEQDNATKEVQGPHDFDESGIAKIKPPTTQEPDEPYMDAFVQDEFHQLADIQQSGEFSNAKAAFKAVLAQAAAAL